MTHSLESESGSVVRQVKLLAADSEAYTSDMFFQSKSESTSGLQSGIVLAKKVGEEPSVSNNILKADSIIGLSSDEGENSHIIDHMMVKEQEKQDILICDEMADKMSIKHR